jgi:hypothetical protein
MALPAPTVAAALRNVLWRSPGKRVYGIVDAARSVELAYEAKLQFGKDITSLFLPEFQTRLWNVAPYIVPIDEESDYVARWAARWASNVGVFVVSGAEEKPLYEHLRRTFVVEDEQKQAFFFRYYDPRVLRPFLPTCSGAQLEQFFGQVDAFFIESEDGEALCYFARHAGKLVEKRLSLEIEALSRETA